MATIVRSLTVAALRAEWAVAQKAELQHGTRPRRAGPEKKTLLTGGGWRLTEAAFESVFEKLFPRLAASGGPLDSRGPENPRQNLNRL